MTLINSELLRKYANIELLAKHLVEGFITGLHKSPYHGFSVEFAEHRLYNPGESIKNIDWKVYARTDRLYVKNYEEETNLRSLLLLDTSSSMFYPKSKIDFSIIASACLLYLLQNQRDAVGICSFSQKIDYLSEIKLSSKHLKNQFNYLNDIRNTENLYQKSSISEILHQIAEKVHKRSLIILISDLIDTNNPNSLEQIFNSFAHLKHKNHEIIVFYVYDKKKEYELDYSNDLISFNDIEIKEKTKTNINSIKDWYKDRFSNRIKNLKNGISKLKIDFIDVDCHDNIDKVLISYLLKRSKLF